MESLKQYALNISEDEYHAYPAWNHSMIARYAREGFSCLPTLHEKTPPTPSMEFGSLFDSMITRGNKTLDNYAVVTMSVPDAERKALDYISTLTDEQFESLDPGWIYDRTQECGYQPKWKMETKYEKLKPYAEYFNLKKSGKKLVSQQDWNDALTMYKVFREDDYLKTIFGTKSTKDIEYLYQIQFCENYQLESGQTVPVKCMFDLLIVNHQDKLIQPVDLKTSSVPAWNFEENFLKFRYDLEAALYTDVLNLVLDKVPDYQDYTVAPYLFVDVSRSDMVPATWEYDPLADSQVNGFSFESNGKTYQYKSWDKLLEEIIYYENIQAKVPEYIRTDGPNDLLAILSRKK